MVVIWAFGLMYVFFRIQKRVQGIRVTRDEEMIGLDVPEMGVPINGRSANVYADSALLQWLEFLRSASQTIIKL